MSPWKGFTGTKEDLEFKEMYYEKGLSLDEMGKILGMKPVCVKQYAYILGIGRKKAAVKLLERKDEIFKMYYENHIPLDKIARRIKITPNAVGEFIRAQGKGYLIPLDRVKYETTSSGCIRVLNRAYSMTAKNHYEMYISHEGWLHISLRKVLYEKKNGKIPEGMFMVRMCDDIKCVNPDHATIHENKCHGVKPRNERQRART